MLIYKQGIAKYLPEDFIVTEKIIFNNISKGNSYSLFILKKNNVSLFNCLMRLSKIIKIPINKFYFFGEKDKYALTKQLVYTPKLNFIQSEIITNDFTFIYLFDIDNIDSNQMIGNKFKVTIRKIENPKLIEEKIKKIINKEILIPNYYDIQRFGKRYINHIIGYYLLNSKYFEATFLLLCAYSKNENRKVKKARSQLKELFNEQVFNIDKATQIKLPQYMDIEKIFLKILSEKRSYKKTWKEFPYKFTSLFKEAYKSYIFNEKIIQFIKSLGVTYYKREYNLTIPPEFDFLISKFPKKIEYIYPTVRIEKEIVNYKIFENQPSRELFIVPQIYSYQFEKDEIFNDYHKLIISFSLSKGEFATNSLNFLLEDI